MIRAGAAGLASLILAVPASRAAGWDGSYSADGRCYCSGTLDPRLASRIVPTPRGGQSVARVCQRIGAGPGLSVVDGRFDRVVYADAQCGHGPSLADGAPVEPACAGTIEPGSDDCRVVGPRWDLASAYARPAPEESANAAAALIGAGVMAAPAAVPVMGAAAATPANAADELAGHIVEIDGRRWREAPDGTPESGPPDTRIILDGRVFLDVEKASAADFLPRGVASRRASATPRKPAAPARAPVARREPSAAEVRARRERLLAAARERLRERAPASALRTPIVAETAERIEPTVAAASPATTDTAADTGVRTGVDDAPAKTQASSDRLSDERRTSALEETAGTIAAEENADETVSPFLQALRMPPATRTSSREFGYVDAMPMSYAYGGGGMMLEGSASMRGRFRALARLGASTDYQELLLGGSWYATPPEADRLTIALTAGVETGRFELERAGVSTELSDSGLYVGAESRFVVNDRFELQAGVGYSSFFEGDPIVFGGTYYHIGRRLDVISRVEVGDNDSLGIGVRYYY